MAAFLGTRVEVGLRRRRGPARTLPLWIPAPYRSTGQALRRDDACGGGQDCRETGTPPRRAPALDTGFRRYDGGGVGVGECCLCRRGTGPAVAGGAFRERPLRRGWRVGSAGRLVMGCGGAAPAPHRGGCGPPFTPFESLRAGFNFPLGERTPRTRTAPPLWVSACAGMTRVMGRAFDGRRGPFDRLRANGLPGSARPLTAPPLWIPASAGMTRRGECGPERDGDAPAHRPCSGFPLSRERRWGEWALRRAWGDPSTGSGRTGAAAHRPCPGYRLSPVWRWGAYAMPPGRFPCCLGG